MISPEPPPYIHAAFAPPEDPLLSYDSLLQTAITSTSLIPPQYQLPIRPDPDPDVDPDLPTYTLHNIENSTTIATIPESTLSALHTLHAHLTAIYPSSGPDDPPPTLPVLTYPYPWTARSPWFDRASAWASPSASGSPSSPMGVATATAANNMTLIRLHQNIVFSFFTAIGNKQDEVVVLFIRDGLVTPETTNEVGMTPLLAAVKAGSLGMVKRLLELGAGVDEWGAWPDTNNPSHKHPFPPPYPQHARTLTLRTPLMASSITGHLQITRLLLSSPYSSNDALISPSDGETALNLARTHHHSEIVSFLPLRRGGGWLRWKTKHAAAVERATKAVQRIGSFLRFVCWEIPRFMVWTLPKSGVVRPVMRNLTWMWVNRGKFPGWVKRQVMVEIPAAVGRVGRGFVRGVKSIPRGLVKGVKGVGRLLRALLRGVVRLPRRIYAMLGVLAAWVGRGLFSIFHAVKHAFLQTISFLHSVVIGVVTLFRTVTLKDIVRHCGRLLSFIFATVPAKVWQWMKELGDVLYWTLKTGLSDLGLVIWWVGWLVMVTVLYVPRKVGVILGSVGASVGAGVEEVWVWWRPKG